MNTSFELTSYGQYSIETDIDPLDESISRSSSYEFSSRSSSGSSTSTSSLSGFTIS